jgi:hypothetical protein
MPDADLNNIGRYNEGDTLYYKLYNSISPDKVIAQIDDVAATYVHPPLPEPRYDCL